MRILDCYCMFQTIAATRSQDSEAKIRGALETISKTALV